MCGSLVTDMAQSSRGESKCRRCSASGGGIVLLVGLLVSLGGKLAAADASQAKQSTPVNFARQVKPILVQHCYRCHGPVKQESGLRLDSLEGMLTGGSRGTALVPGRSSESLLVQAVRGQVAGEPDLKMPQDSQPLSAHDVELIVAWIDAGAPVEEADRAPGHWAYRLPQKVALPETHLPGWNDNPIDRLVAIRHAELGLRPAEEAPREVLARRVYLDLTGLPPTATELEDFLSDTSPDAYERLVDRLLASAAYGERWARHWMDVWRYSDWSGYGKEVRESQPHIWRWRDWIIESLNQDKPYNRMILEMLAGDEIAPDDPQTLRATGFLVRNWFRFNRNTWLEDTVEHTAKGFLGLTINCAKCHDHMYDPVTQEEYYRFRAFFEPHQVRTDVLTTLNTELDGLPRVYDTDAPAPTYVFERGDERKPDKSRAVTPALPASFGGTLPIEPVRLTPKAFYPGLRQEVRQLMRRDLETRFANALEAQVVSEYASNEEWAPDVSPMNPPEKDLAIESTTWAERSAAAELAAVRAAAARYALAALEAKMAADDRVYLDDGTCSAAERQAKVFEAALAECRHTLAEKYAALLDSVLQYDRVTRESGSSAAGDAKQKEQLWARTLKTQQELAAAQQALANCQPDSARYSPLTQVYPSTSTGRRLALASWIASPQNPLTARVAINHIWMRHFGQPLVERVFDFGYSSPPPRLAEVLDWLAVEFIEQGWRMKPIHRLIVTSRLYRSRSWTTPDDAANIKIDPDNQYFWRMNARRVEAEVVRDCLLAVSGRLDRTVGGPDIDHESGLTTTRRSIYYRHAYEKQMLFLKLFDAASVVECYRRSESITPQQALALSNSQLSLASARYIIRSSNPPLDLANNSRVRNAIRQLFLTVLSREPQEEEIILCRDFLEKQSVLLADPAKLTKMAPSNNNVTPPPASNPVLRAWENLAHVLLNHNDFVTLR